MEDFEEAVRIGQRVIQIISDSENRSKFAETLNNFANILGNRYEQTKTTKDLEEAIRLTRQTIEIISDDHSHLAFFLINLEGRLESRYDQTETRRNLKKAIQIFEYV